MTSRKVGVEILDLDGNGLRCAVAVDGLVRYVGPVEECRRRAQILLSHRDRERENQMLVRAVA